MSDRLFLGLGLLAMAIAFGGSFAWQLRSGSASFYFNILGRAERIRNSTAYWSYQSAWALATAVYAVAGVGVLAKAFRPLPIGLLFVLPFSVLIICLRFVQRHRWAQALPQPDYKSDDTDKALSTALANLDVERAAAALIKRYGAHATAEATHRAEALTQIGDTNGANVWHGIVEALQRQKRPTK